MKSFRELREANKEVWDKPNPVKKHEKLSSSNKSRAKARARAAGRPYPNMVDNIWAARNEAYERPNKYPDGKPIPADLPPKYQASSNADVPKNQRCNNCEYFEEDNNKCSKFNNAVVRPLYWCAKWEPEEKDESMNEASPAWARKEGKNPEGGLNRKGIESYRRENPGSKLSMAVTTPPSKLKPGSKAANRRKSFCARMGGSAGPMKDEKGNPTRKALALRKWNC